MRRLLIVSAAVLMVLSPAAMAQNRPDRTPGLNTDMGDMALEPGTALPPPGMEAGRVVRMQPGESGTLPPSQMYPDVAPAGVTRPSGALAPTDTPEAITPVPADTPQVRTPLIP